MFNGLAGGLHWAKLAGEIDHRTEGVRTNARSLAQPVCRLMAGMLQSRADKRVADEMTNVQADRAAKRHAK